MDYRSARICSMLYSRNRSFEALRQGEYLDDLSKPYNSFASTLFLIPRINSATSYRRSEDFGVTFQMSLYGLQWPKSDFEFALTTRSKN